MAACPSQEGPFAPSAGAPNSVGGSTGGAARYYGYGHKNIYVRRRGCSLNACVSEDCDAVHIKNFKQRCAGRSNSKLDPSQQLIAAFTKSCRARAGIGHKFFRTEPDDGRLARGKHFLLAEGFDMVTDVLLSILQ